MITLLIGYLVWKSVHTIVQSYVQLNIGFWKIRSYDPYWDATHSYSVSKYRENQLIVANNVSKILCDWRWLMG